MIFAAGLGTRLKEFTHAMPKALVPVGGKPMLGILIDHLEACGYDDLIVNVHHFAARIVSYIDTLDFSCSNISISNEEDQLLDTGGGLKKAAWFFNDGKPFLAQNVDVLCDVDYASMTEELDRKQALAVLAVSHRETSRYLLFDTEMRLCGWENCKTGEKKIAVQTDKELQQFAFSGIQVFDPGIFDKIRFSGKFSLIDLYLDLAEQNLIIGYQHDPAGWVDMGTAENLIKAETLIRTKKL